MGVLMLVYTVRTAIDDEDTRLAYLSWLVDGHAAEVVRAGGAVRAEVSTLDDGTLETRYVFASRDAFAAYEAGPAIALRADANEKFPPAAAIRVTRSTGTLAATFPA
jgi:hypothetical protein